MKKTFKAVAMGCLFALCVLSQNVFSQQGIVSIDRVSNYWNGYVWVGGNMRVVIRFQNNTGERESISNGFKISTPDGVTWDSVTVDSIGYQNGGVSQFKSYFDVVFGLWNRSNGFNSIDTVGLLAAGVTGNPLRNMPIGYNDTSLAIVIWNINAISYPSYICIDSTFFGSGGPWKWVSSTIPKTYYPEFRGLAGQVYSNGIPGSRIGSGYCFQVFSCESKVSSGDVLIAPSAASSDCGSCCKGGANGNIDGIDGVDIGDLSVLIAYLSGEVTTLSCLNEANIDNIGGVDITDLSALVNYLTGGGFKLQPCL